MGALKAFSPFRGTQGEEDVAGEPEVEGGFFSRIFERIARGQPAGIGVPPLPPIPPPPPSLDPGVIEGDPARERAEVLRRGRRGGRRSTILGGTLSPGAVAVPGAVGQSRILGG